MAFELEMIDEMLSFRYFKSIDICNGESQLLQPFENFRPLYEKIHAYKLRRKARVGEYGGAEDIVQAGIPVSINTDDLQLFTQTIGGEYLNLFKSGALSASE